MAFRVTSTRQRPNPRPVPSLWSIALNKAASMAMASEGSSRRLALLAQLSRQPMTEIPAGVTLPMALEQHKEQIMTREGLHGVLSFATGNDLEAAIKTVYVLEKGGAWREWVGPLHLAKHHGCVDALPIQMTARDLRHIGIKWRFDGRPERVRQFSLFGHRLKLQNGEKLSLREMEYEGFWQCHEAPKAGCAFSYDAKDPPCDDNINFSVLTGTFSSFQGAVLYSIQGGEEMGGMKTLAYKDMVKELDPQRYARALAIHQERSPARLKVQYEAHEDTFRAVSAPPDETDKISGSRITLHGDKAGDEYALYLAIELRQEEDDPCINEDDDDDLFGVFDDHNGPWEVVVVKLLTTAKGTSQKEAAVAKAREVLGEADMRMLFNRLLTQGSSSHAQRASAAP